MNEQLKLAHKSVDEVNRANRKICVTLLQHIVDKPETSYAQVRLFAMKNENEKFQQTIYVKYEFEEFIFLLDVTKSVYDKVVANTPICNVLQNVIATIYSLSFYFLFESA